MVLLAISTCSVTEMLLTLQPGGDTETQSHLNSSQGRKSSCGIARRRIWTHPSASQLQQAPLSSFFCDSCWHITAAGTCNQLSPLCTPEENTKSTEHSAKQQENALLGDLSPRFFPSDYFYSWENQAETRTGPQPWSSLLAYLHKAALLL